MKILAFGATTSSTSINKALAGYAASLVKGAEVELIDLNDFQLPIFNTDIEKGLGVPVLAQAFFDKIGQADALIIAFAEHNGSYTAAYKNTFDWASRIDKKVFQNKAMVLLAASPGPGGAMNVLTAASASAPHFAGIVKGSLSFNNFYDRFDLTTQQLRDSTDQNELSTMVNKLVG